MTSTISLTDTYALTVSDSPDSEQTPWATLRDVTYPQAIDYTCYISRNWTGAYFHVTAILPDGPLYIGYARYGTFHIAGDKGSEN